MLHFILVTEFYSPMLLPYHLPFILLGVFIRKLLKTPRGRWLWLGVEIAALILSGIGSGSSDGLTVIASYCFCLLSTDLLIGHGIIGIIQGIRWLADWIKKENEEPAAEGGIT